MASTRRDIDIPTLAADLVRIFRERGGPRRAERATGGPRGRPAVAVAVDNVVKTYAAPGGERFNAVDGVSFEVRPGELFGFLGPNGAGKTTTLEILEGIREPTSGSATVLGLDSVGDREELKRRIGVQLQAGAYFSYLTLEEILALFGSFYPRRREPAELLGLVGLLDKRRAQVRHLSGGQARRFSVVAALVNDPEVVFLDEPTTGLDPAARRVVWDLIRQINRDEGKTVVLTTHYMEEAELLADRVAILREGRIVAIGSPQELLGDAGAVEIRYRRNGDVVVLHTDEPTRLLHELTAEALAEGRELEGLEVQRRTLEDVYFEVTQE